MQRRKRTNQPQETKVGPTPETARKLTFDPLLALYHAGTITGTHLHCAEEIATAFMLLTLPVSMRLSNPGREGTSDPVGRMDQWAEALEKRWKLIARYNGWRKTMRRAKVSFGIAEAVIMDRRSCREVSRSFRVRNGAVGIVVHQALDIYAKEAGYSHG